MSVEPKTIRFQSTLSTLSTELQTRTAEIVFEGYISHIVYYTCITYIGLSHHAMGRSRNVKKYSMRQNSQSQRANLRTIGIVPEAAVKKPRRRRQSYWSESKSLSHIQCDWRGLQAVLIVIIQAIVAFC